MANSRNEEKEIIKDVDIYQYPSQLDKRNGNKPVDLALGDLHANYIKLVYFLITTGVVTLPEEKYLQLVNIYQTQLKLVELLDRKIRFDKKISDFNKRIDNEKSKAISESYTLETQQNEINKIRQWIENDTKRESQEAYDSTKEPKAYLAELGQLKQEAESILSSIEVVNGARIILIGDELADRGASDYETLYLLNHLRAKGAAITTIVSNHGMEFLELHERDKGFEQPSLGKGQAGSVVMIDRYLAGGYATRDQLNDLVSSYKQTLELLTYTLSPDKKNITLYTHAPADLSVIKHIANFFEIDYRATTAEELAATIDLINLNFKSRLEAGTAHELFPNLDHLQNNGVSEARLTPDQIAEYPFFALIWNRTYDILDRTTQPAAFTINYVHGHDKGREAGDELANVTNLDGDLGKYTIGEHRNTGNLSYSEAPTSQNRIILDQDDILDQTQRVLLGDLVRKIRALPAAYQLVKGNKTKHNTETVKLLVKQVNHINDRNDLTDDEKRASIIRLVFEKYRLERLHYSNGDRSKQNGYVDYLNANQHKERFARMLGLILQSEIKNDQRLYLVGNVQHIHLPTTSNVGELESTHFKKISIPKNDQAYTALTQSALSNKLIIDFKTVTPENGRNQEKPIMISKKAEKQKKDNLQIAVEKITALQNTLITIGQMIGATPHPRIPETLVKRYWDRLSATGITGVDQLKELLSGKSEDQIKTAKQAAHIIAQRLKAGSARHGDVQDFYLTTFSHLVALIEADSSEKVNAAQDKFKTVTEQFFTSMHLGKQFENVGSIDEEIERSTSLEDDFSNDDGIAPPGWVAGQTWESANRWNNSSRPSESSNISSNDEVPPPRRARVLEASATQERLDELNGMVNLTPEQLQEKEKLEKQLENTPAAKVASEAESRFAELSSKINLTDSEEAEKAVALQAIREEHLQSFINELKQVIGATPLRDPGVTQEDYLQNGAKMFWDQKAFGTVKGIEKLRLVLKNEHAPVSEIAQVIETVANERLHNGPGFFSKRHDDVSKLYRCIKETMNGIRNAQLPVDAKINLNSGEKTLSTLLESIRRNYESYLGEKQSIDQFLGFDNKSNDENGLRPRQGGSGKK